MSETVKVEGKKKKGIFALLMESIAKSNDGCGPGCGCHADKEKKPAGDNATADTKKKPTV